MTNKTDQSEESKVNEVFTIVAQSSVSALIRSINMKLVKGYRLHGSSFMLGDQICQQMIKPGLMPKSERDVAFERFMEFIELAKNHFLNGSFDMIDLFNKKAPTDATSLFSLASFVANLDPDELKKMEENLNQGPETDPHSTALIRISQAFRSIQSKLWKAEYNRRERIQDEIDADARLNTDIDEKNQSEPSLAENESE